MQIKLLVIRTPDQKRLAEFYSLLGLQFDYHKHGNSPYHYGTTINGTVLEIYPLAKSQPEPDKHLRLGLSIENFDTIIDTLKDIGIEFIAQPMQTDFGYMAIICDPDGRKVEIYKV
ncbi:VOC family protein [Mucilaginibacter sp.]|uniref:VOC family protein n=1 Tax=Mucilaginibacter sp. TaxID=1882438 RepID=UPI0032647B27